MSKKAEPASKRGHSGSESSNDQPSKCQKVSKKSVACRDKNRFRVEVSQRSRKKPVGAPDAVKLSQGPSSGCDEDEKDVQDKDLCVGSTTRNRSDKGRQGAKSKSSLLEKGQQSEPGSNLKSVSFGPNSTSSNSDRENVVVKGDTITRPSCRVASCDLGNKRLIQGEDTKASAFAWSSTSSSSGNGKLIIDEDTRDTEPEVEPVVKPTAKTTVRRQKRNIEISDESSSEETQTKIRPAKKSSKTKGTNKTVGKESCTEGKPGQSTAVRTNKAAKKIKDKNLDVKRTGNGKVVNESSSPSPPSLSSDNESGDSDILDSRSRERLVSELINSACTTVQYESFILSLPRSEVKELAFRQKICDTCKLLSDIEKTNIISKYFQPSFIKAAEKVIKEFKKAMKVQDKDDEDEKDGTKESTPIGAKLIKCDKQLNNGQQNALMVEGQIPHSMFWVLNISDVTICGSWEGQFVAGVNPIDSVLSITLFRFMPQYSSEAVASLRAQELSKTLAGEIRENLQVFEASTQVRVDIDLKEVITIYLHSPKDIDHEGLLLLEVNSKPKTYQRCICVSAEEKNKWNRCEDIFWNNNSDVTLPILISLGGFVSELDELVALMLASQKSLSEVFQEGTERPYVKQSNCTDEQRKQGDKIKVTRIECEKTNEEKSVSDDDERFLQETTKRRAKIIDVLLQYKLISKDDAAHAKAELVDTITGTNCEINNHLEGLDLPICLSDYINFKCEDSEILDTLLQLPLNASKYGFTKTEFAKDGQTLDIDSMTVAELIRTKASAVVYFSFCYGEIAQEGHDHHCERCHKCSTWNYWHCIYCEKCSYGTTMPICEHCGHLKDDTNRTIIKPMSVFKKQLEAGYVPFDDIREEWVRAYSEEGMTWKRPSLEEEVRGTEADVSDYTPQNAMVDELGLINPLSFMLNMPPSQAARKHRREDSLKPPKLEEGGGKGPPCVLQ